MSDDYQRPPTGLGHYLRDTVYGALDGVVTTLAVVSAVMGAWMPTRVALVLGLANLLGDGISMGASNYLGMKSELEQTGRSVRKEKPLRHGLATLVAFMVAGAVPLLGLLAPRSSQLAAACGLALGVLALAGGARARFVHKSVWRSALEMVLVAGFAAASAYLVGRVSHQVLPG